MDFALTDEHLELIATVERWAEANFGSARLREPNADGKRLDARWQEAANYGWLGLLVPLDEGGSGGTMVDAVLVAEALARHLAPIPYGGNAIIAAVALELVTDHGSHREALAAGSERFSLLTDTRLGWPAATAASEAAPARAWEWTPGAGLLVASGTGLRVRHDLAVSPLDGEDLLRTVGTVGTVAGEQGAYGGPYERVQAAAHLATTAALCGAMAGAMAVAVEHAKNRHQFGRPIGSFQAIAHLCADMLVDVETSRTALLGAAWAFDHLSNGEALTAAATAKAWAAPAARRVCEAAIQVHGGMGFTWECDAHLFLRSAILCGDAFGGEAAALDQVAAGALNLG